MKRIVALGLFLFIALTAGLSLASSVLPLSPEEHLQRSLAAFRGEVVRVQSYENPADGLIYTRTVLRLDEVFKGRLPAYVQVVHRGGEVGGVGQMDDASPQFKVGEQRLVFLSRRADGTLFTLQGQAGALLLPPAGAAPGAMATPRFAPGTALLQALRARTPNGPLPGSDVTDQSGSLADQSSGVAPNTVVPLASPTSGATNLLVGSDGIPARFILPDRAEPIPYLIDADFLPAGMTLAQATNAVNSALAAWTNASSVRYQFRGLQSFGQGADKIGTRDGVLRIQLHDHYNSIGGGSGSGDILGIGGHGWLINNTPSGWTLGGNVAGNDFHRVSYAYVVLASTNTFMQNVTNFAEVLTHEIGHTIGLDHSSQDPNEPNPLLKQAIMYYAAHGNGRGATLNAWDTNVVRQVHPPSNTPPYCYDRMMDIVTAPSPFTTPGVNTVQVRAYKLQPAALTLLTDGATANNGSFSEAGSNITYTPLAWFSDSGRLDPGGSSFYDAVFARYSDSLNASPYATIRVLSFNSDSSSEGIPDWWRVAFFGSSSPSTGLKHHATDDADGDGFNNITEWWLGSAPTNATSNLRITSFKPLTLQWPAKGYEVYELYGSSNLVNWTRVLNPLVPTNAVPGTNLLNLTNSVGIATGFTNGAHYQFYRILKVP